ncbi:MAG: metallophosphoesterase [archaeon]
MPVEKPESRKKKPRGAEREILRGARIAGLGLYFEKSNCLVISDLHLGFEEALNKQGVFVPRFNFAEIKKALEKILSGLPKLEKIIVNGDLKHEFGTISRQEWNEVLAIMDLLERNCGEIILVRGNHDKILGPLAERKGLKIREDGFYLENEGVFCTHGDKVRRTGEYKKAKIILIGNEHPAITLREGVKSEKYKCFLRGKFGGKILVVLPSFNFVSVGTDLSREKPISPFLKRDLENFEVWAIEDKAYYFGKLGKMK